MSASLRTRGPYSASLKMLRTNGPSCAQVREHCEDPAMIFVRGLELQLLEDAVDVTLDGLGTERKGVTDRGVRASLRHELQHLAFALGEVADEVPMSTADHQLRDHLRIDGRSTRGNASHGLDEIVHVGDPVLEQVADPIGAALEQPERVRGLDVLRKKEDGDAGMALPDRRRGLKSFGRVRGWHADVGDRDVGRVRVDEIEQLRAVPRAADDLEAGALE